jgi:hypothetical protein
VHIASEPPTPPSHSQPTATLNLDWTNLSRRQELSPHLLQAVRGWHEIRARSRFDAARFLADFGSHLIFSRSREAEPRPRPSRLEPNLQCFHLPDDVYIALKHESMFGTSLTLWATTAALAQSTFETLRAKYALARMRQTNAPVFYTLKAVGEEVGVQPISLPPQYRKLWLTRKRVGCAYAADEWLALHYGATFPAWHEQFVERLREMLPRGGGLTLLRGEPGTGKSTYLRFLLAQLRRTHRFYYLPANAFHLLTNPAMVEFWLQEGKDHKGRGGRVVIIEDAERLLMERAADNRDALSNLLNLADGFLGDALQLHIIATVNCPLERIDPALLRPGRLLASYAFERLTEQQAKKLAVAEGLTPPVTTDEQSTYSLADLYAKPTVTSIDPSVQSRRVGF